MKNKKRKPHPLALHEAGHAIAAAAYGVPLSSEGEGYAIEMTYEDSSGAVHWDETAYELLTVEQKTVLALAGLAAERYFHKDCGVVYWTEKKSKNLSVLHVPKEYKCLSNEDGTGDLNTVHDLMPMEVRMEYGADEEWCNRHLKTAWHLLHQHEAAFLELTNAISPEQRSVFGCELGVDYTDHTGIWVFDPSDVEHILVKVRPTTKTRRKKAA